LTTRAWDHSTFSKNRDRLLEHAVVESFFTQVMGLADQRGLLSKEQFSVDGTLIQAWASHESFVPKEGQLRCQRGWRAQSAGELEGHPRAATTRMRARPIRVRCCR
jgi:hypothetical protein